MYTSHPTCCKGASNYNPSASKEECEDYSGCKYAGQFAGVDGKLSPAEVEKRNIVAFYDDKNQKSCGDECAWWDKNVKGKKIMVRNPENGTTLTVEPLDTCGNHDCKNCCSKNSGGGVLIDFEIFTAKRFYGGKVKDKAPVEWKWV